MTLFRRACLLFLFAGSTWAQGQTEHPVPKTAPHRPGHFRIAPLLGHTLVALESGKAHRLIASYGLDLEYWPSGKWGIGLHNDIEMENFVIIRQGQSDLERSRPIVTTLDVLYKIWRDLVLLAGPGVEIDPQETLALLRVGLEYEFELNDHWDFSPALMYDTRRGAFDTWSFGIGVGRRF